MTLDLAFIGNRINRQSEKRNEQSFQDALNNQPYCIVLNGGSVLYKQKDGQNDLYLDKADLAHFTPIWDDACLLGMESGRPVIGVPVVEFPDNPTPPLFQTSVRGVYLNGLFALNQSGALAQAYSSVTWHRNNHFCSRCGGESRMVFGGVKRVCIQCDTQYFPRTDPVAIMLVHYKGQALLARTPNFEEKRYSCLAGFIEQGETLEVAVRRETREEMGVSVGQVTYGASQPWPFPHSLMLGCWAEALSPDITIDYEEMEDGRWFSRAELATMVEGHHKDGLTLPAKGAIAYYLITKWLENS